MVENMNLDDTYIEYPEVQKELFAEGTLPVYTDEHAEAIIFGGKAALDGAFDGLDTEHAVALADATEDYSTRMQSKITLLKGEGTK